MSSSKENGQPHFDARDSQKLRRAIGLGTAGRLAVERAVEEAAALKESGTMAEKASVILPTALHSCKLAKAVVEQLLSSTGELVDYTETPGVLSQAMSNVSSLLECSEAIMVRSLSEDAEAAAKDGTLERFRELFPQSAEEVASQEVRLRLYLSRETYGAYDFILERDEYQKWLHSRSPTMLGIMTLYGRFAPVVYINCRHERPLDAVAILQCLIWSIISKRPRDVFVHSLLDVDYYAQTFKHADDFDELWRVFVQLVKSLRQVWIILDSVHDCKGDLRDLLGGLTKLVESSQSGPCVKVALSSRQSAAFCSMVPNAVHYTPQDMRNGVSIYVEQELQRVTAPWKDSSLLVRYAVEAIDRLGGGIYWAQLVINRLRLKASSEKARQYLTGLRRLEQIETALVQNFKSNGNVFNQGFAVILQSDKPLTANQVHAALRQDSPSVIEGISVDDLRSLLLDNSGGTLLYLDGAFIVPTRVFRPLQVEWLKLRTRCTPAVKTHHRRKSSKQAKPDPLILSPTSWPPLVPPSDPKH
ncbi:hypothetical protein F4778DRAFT_779615 [Xylariomycetidae sp. FL2044]|nr:hypothetical protein F4778DRAFT_779615 [Xylariomycetidae sp. FL2044]